MNAALDDLFGALADPTRRAILDRLRSGEASAGDLARPFAMSQPAVSRHLATLQNAGLVTIGAPAPGASSGSSPTVWPKSTHGSRNSAWR
jgi:DNA-binding transcriptional ArsR family regulator